MSKFNTRDIHQRRMSQAANILDTPLMYLKDFIEVYEPTHPELSKSAKVIAEVLLTAQTALEQFKRTF